jgi:mannose-6-phosphate isomerase
MSTTYVAGERDERPWGCWEIIAIGRGYAVKRIVVRSGKRLSLQRHALRAEHWVIVCGLARITRGAETFSLSAGEHVAIACGDAHRIENRGTEDLVFIEVQHGERLDENDIERLQDDYGRR